jgi:hypothetical protein
LAAVETLHGAFKLSLYCEAEIVLRIDAERGEMKA